MGLHRRLAGEDLAGDLGVGQPARDRVEDLALLVGQRRGTPPAPASGLRNWPSSSVERSAGREHRVAGVHGADRVAQHHRRRVLEQEPAGAVPDRGRGPVVEVERRQHDDPHRLRRGGPPGRAGRSAGSPRRRPSPASGCPSAPRRARARRPAAPPRGRRAAEPTTSMPVLGVDDHPDALAEQLLVVDEQDPDRRRSSAHLHRHPRGRRERRPPGSVAAAYVEPAADRLEPAAHPVEPLPAGRDRRGHRRAARLRRAGRRSRCAPRSAASPSQCRSTRTGRSRRPCLIALVSISWSTRKATTSSSGGSGCGVPTSVEHDLVAARPGRPSTRLSRPAVRAGAAVPSPVVAEHLPHVLRATCAPRWRWSPSSA